MADAETPKDKAEPGNQSVQLGIGTLIIIALIVTMCSGRSEMEKIQKDTGQLKEQLGVIERKLDALATPGSARDTPGSQDPAATPSGVPEASVANP